MLRRSRSSPPRDVLSFFIIYDVIIPRSCCPFAPWTFPDLLLYVPPSPPSMDLYVLSGTLYCTHELPRSLLLPPLFFWPPRSIPFHINNFKLPRLHITHTLPLSVPSRRQSHVSVFFPARSRDAAVS